MHLEADIPIAGKPARPNSEPKNVRISDFESAGHDNLMCHALRGRWSQPGEPFLEFASPNSASLAVR